MRAVASFGDDPTKIEVILPLGGAQVMLADVATKPSFQLFGSGYRKCGGGAGDIPHGCAFGTTAGLAHFRSRAINSGNLARAHSQRWEYACSPAEIQGSAVQWSDTTGDNIRATHIRFLNDWTEFREAFNEDYGRLLLDSFRAELPSDLPADAARLADAVLSNRLSGILEIAAASEAANDTFVCSFTSAEPVGDGDAGDQLSQWRGYSGAEQGFSLGFDKELLRERATFDNRKAKAILEHCVYNDTEKRAFFEEIGSSAGIQFRRMWQEKQPIQAGIVTRPTLPEDYERARVNFLVALSQVTSRLFGAAARVKNPGFREEREWRVIFQADKGALAPTDDSRGRIEIVKFRDGPFGRTPYIEIPLRLTEPGSPLRRIVVGPGALKDSKKSYAELLLLNRGIQVSDPSNGMGVKVVTSSIPYRTH